MNAARLSPVVCYKGQSSSTALHSRSVGFDAMQMLSEPLPDQTPLVMNSSIAAVACCVTFTCTYRIVRIGTPSNTK